MKTNIHRCFRAASAFILAAAVAGLTSCTTTYDAAGRPQQSVDPGLAVAGVAAAGLLGYALADNHHDHHYNHHYSRPYYGRRY